MGSETQFFSAMNSNQKALNAEELPHRTLARLREVKLKEEYTHRRNVAVSNRNNKERERQKDQSVTYAAAAPSSSSEVAAAVPTSATRAAAKPMSKDEENFIIDNLSYDFEDTITTNVTSDKFHESYISDDSNLGGNSYHSMLDSSSSSKPTVGTKQQQLLRSNSADTAVNGRAAARSSATKATPDKKPSSAGHKHDGRGGGSGFTPSSEVKRVGCICCEAMDSLAGECMPSALTLEQLSTREFKTNLARDIEVLTGGSSGNSKALNAICTAAKAIGGVLYTSNNSGSSSLAARNCISTPIDYIINRSKHESNASSSSSSSYEKASEVCCASRIFVDTSSRCSSRARRTALITA